MASLPVLMYHDVVDDPERIAASHRPYVVSAATFRDHLHILAALGVTGTRLDFQIDPPPGPARPGTPCVLTFDDGHESNCTRALPALLEAGFGATFFVTVGWVGRSPYMSWDQIRSLAAAGMEIGSHSMTHRPPTGLSRAELLSEMADSRKALEDRLGQPILTASSPTGFYNPQLVPAAQEAGYRGLCFGRIALWRAPRDAYRIPRLPVKLRTTSRELSGMASGDRGLIARMRAQQLVRNGLKKTLGVDLYIRLRRVLLGGGNSPGGSGDRKDRGD